MQFWLLTRSWLWWTPYKFYLHTPTQLHAFILVHCSGHAACTRCVGSRKRVIWRTTLPKNNMEHVKESVKDNIQEIPTFPGTNLQVACSTSGVQINNIEYIFIAHRNGCPMSCKTNNKSILWRLQLASWKTNHRQGTYGLPIVRRDIQDVGWRSVGDEDVHIHRNLRPFLSQNNTWWLHANMSRDSAVSTIQKH